jgi:signal transduction histidine kinase
VPRPARGEPPGLLAWYACPSEKPPPPVWGDREVTPRGRRVPSDIGAASSPLRADAVDVLVDLLTQIDAGTEIGEFYDRLCEAVCRLTSMERAGLYLYDPTLRVVRAVGSHGVDPSLLQGVEGTLDETPIAQRALASDSVVAASERLEEELPPRYARFAGITTITCTPVSAAGRWLGVIFADRGGGSRFELTDEERQAMWSLGKLAALAASVEQATIQREAARSLAERIDLIREIHERVIQRLFGLLLVLGSEGELDADTRRTCHDELREVVGELRGALGRARDERERTTTTMGLRQALGRIAAIRDDLQVDWPDEVEVPAEIEELARDLLLEAIRNADKHASASCIEVLIRSEDGNFSLEVINDGANGGGSGRGLGLRLATIEALRHSGIVEFGPLDGGRWHVRLVAPLEPAGAVR